MVSCNSGVKHIYSKLNSFSCGSCDRKLREIKWLIMVCAHPSLCVIHHWPVLYIMDGKMYPVLKLACCFFKIYLHIYVSSTPLFSFIQGIAKQHLLKLLHPPPHSHPLHRIWCAAALRHVLLATGYQVYGINHFVDVSKDTTLNFFVLCTSSLYKQVYILV